MKKILPVILLISALFLGGADFAFAQSSVYSASDLVKTRDSSTVYYFGYDGKRHAFPNETVYFSWYSNFEGIKTITPPELANIQLGKNIVIRPGTHLIKIQSDPKVYAVEPKGKLRYIPSEEAAQYLYGQNWSRNIVDINVAFFPDYSVENTLNYGNFPEGTIFRYSGKDEAYILKNERVWSFRDLAQAEAHRYQQRFILNLVNQNVNVESGDKEISEIHPILIDTAQTLGEGYDSFFFIDEGDTDDDDGNGNGNGNGDDDELPFDTDINGLMGYYYSGANFDKQEVVRIDSVVDFSWDAGSPMSLIPSDNFSVRWIGKIKIDETRDYNFWTWSDDGVRLYIDDQLVVNNWTNHMTRWDSGRVNLTEGYHDIKLEYYEKTNGSFIKLCWDARNNVIPKTSLFPITGTYIGN